MLFLSSDFFFKINFKKNSFRNTIRGSNCSDPEQAQHSVGPDLGTKCLQTYQQRTKGKSDNVLPLYLLVSNDFCHFENRCNNLNQIIRHCKEFNMYYLFELKIFFVKDLSEQQTLKASFRKLCWLILIAFLCPLQNILKQSTSFQKQSFRITSPFVRP